MTTNEFKKVARLLKEAYTELEKEAARAGVSLLSPEYEELVNKTREKVLEKLGFTLREYREAKAKVAGFSQIDIVEETEKIGGRVEEEVKSSLGDIHSKLEELDERYIPSVEDIAHIARQIAEEYVVPPQVTNQIVKETIVEKPITVVNKEEFDDTELNKKLEELGKKIEDLPKVDLDGLRSEFQKNLKDNIDTLGMPNFRKIAMGLQQQIDELGGPAASVTHTGEVTGETALTVDKTAITNKTEVTAAVGDYVLVADASDSNNLKKVTVQTIVDQAVGSGVSESLAIAYAAAL